MKVHRESAYSCPRPALFVSCCTIGSFNRPVSSLADSEKFCVSSDELERIRQAGYALIWVNLSKSHATTPTSTHDLQESTCEPGEQGIYIVDEPTDSRLIHAVSAVAEKRRLDLGRSWWIARASVGLTVANRLDIKTIGIETTENVSSPITPAFSIPTIHDAIDFVLSGYGNLQKYCDAFATTFDDGDLALIGGLSRSGKTTFAQALRYSLSERGFSARVLSIDRWLKDLHLRTPGVTGRYDLSEIKSIISRRRNYPETIELNLPSYHKILKRCVHTGEAIQIRPEDILIVEGTIALSIAPPSTSVHRYFVQIDEYERRRRVEREYRLRGESGASAAEIYNSRQRDETPEIMSALSGATMVDIKSILTQRHSSAG